MLESAHGFLPVKAPDKFPFANAPQFFPRMSIDSEIASKKFVIFLVGMPRFI
jgi:hypothetical protein